MDAFVGVPVDSTGRFAGCERMPAALRAAAIVERLDLRDLGNLQATIADPRRDATTGVLGVGDLLGASEIVGTSLASLLAVGATPLVSGGDCAILPGIVTGVAAARPGAGVVHIDGHLDTYDGRTSPTGEAADMDLAMLLEGLPPGGEPILPPDRVIAVGARDVEEARRLGALDPATLGVPVIPWTPAFDAAAAAASVVARVGAWEGHWVHLDLDVLSTTAMPAVDYPQPGGLDWDDLADLLGPVVADPRLLGLDVTILNPTLDPDGAAADRTVQFLVEVLS